MRERRVKVVDVHRSCMAHVDEHKHVSVKDAGPLGREGEGAGREGQR